MLARRTRELAPSGTALARAAAQDAMRDGGRVYDLSSGEILVSPPELLREGAAAAIQRGVGRYTDSIGLPALRAAVARSLTRGTGAAWDASEVAITAGAKQGLLNAVLCLLNPGDEAIIVRPCWPTFPAQVILAGAKPVFIEARAPSYLPRAQDVEAAVRPATRLLIVNSPNNPTGAVYPGSLLQEIAAIAERHDLWIISDECYAAYVHSSGGPEAACSVSTIRRSRTVVVNAYSKQLAVTGWRIGYMAAPAELIKAAKTLQGHMTSNPNVIAQHAVLHYLEAEDTRFESETRARLREAREGGLRILSRLRDVSAAPADGGFFFYLDVSRLLDGAAASPGGTADAIAAYLLREAGVAVVSGTTFGDPAGLRLSYGVPVEELSAALERVVHALDGLREQTRPQLSAVEAR